MVREGEIYETNNCGHLEVKIYNNALDVECEFIDTGTRVITSSNHIKNGNVKDRMMPTVYGVGFVGVGRHSTRDGNKNSKPYSMWCNMLKRCYCEKHHEKKPTYRGCTVCEEWHNFQNFAEWYEDQNTFEGCQLDKDLKVKGNKLYSPEFCSIVSNDMNCSASGRGLKSTSTSGVTGVGFHKHSGKWYAHITVHGDKKWLGLHESKESAIEARSAAFEFYKGGV